MSTKLPGSMARWRAGLQAGRPGVPWTGLSATVALLLCLGALLLPGLCAAAAGQDALIAPNEVTLDEYIAQLDRCLESLKTPEQTAGLRASLPAVWEVHAGSDIYRVSTERITSQLRELEGKPEKPKQLLAGLQKLVGAMRLAAVEMREAKADPNPQAAERLKEILSRREFSGAAGPSPWDVFLAKLGRWIESILGRFFGKLHIGANTGNFLAWGVMLLAYLCLCYMAWKWIAGLTPTRPSLPVLAAPPSDARHWVSEALAAAERRDYREAIHCAYWAAIAKLEDLKMLTRDRARTPRESLGLLERNPKEQSLLRAMTGPFELAWYGYRPAGEREWSGVKEQLEKMGCLEASTRPTANS